MPKDSIHLIYEDENLIAVNKPPGISVTKDRSGKPDLPTILASLDPQFADQIRIIHRLDKETSGIILFARNKETQQRFSEAFQAQKVEKVYLAFVTGVFSEEAGTVDLPLSRDPKDTTKMKVSHKKGKNSVTDWQILADFGMSALVAARPRTGRTHQIRVHLAAGGMPLAIDPAYAGSRPIFLSDFKPNYRTSRGKKEKPLISRLTLHAYQLTLPEGLYPGPRTLTAKMEQHFAAAVKMLSKHNPNQMDAYKNPQVLDDLLNARPLE